MLDERDDFSAKEDEDTELYLDWESDVCVLLLLKLLLLLPSPVSPLKDLP